MCPSLINFFFGDVQTGGFLFPHERFHTNVGKIYTSPMDEFGKPATYIPNQPAVPPIENKVVAKDL